MEKTKLIRRQGLQSLPSAKGGRGLKQSKKIKPMEKKLDQKANKELTIMRMRYLCTHPTLIEMRDRSIERIKSRLPSNLNRIMTMEMSMICTRMKFMRR